MSWHKRIAPYVWWPAFLFVMLAVARAYKFRLGPAGAGFLRHDVAVALIAGILCRFATAARARWMRIAVSAFVTTLAFWLSLAGFIVTNLLHTPVTAALLAQATDFMFVQAALGDTTVSSSLMKFGAVAIVFPIAGSVVAAFLDRRMVLAGRTWIGVAAAFAVAIVCARRGSDAQYRDTNALVTTVASSLGFVVEKAPPDPGVPPGEFQSRVAAAGNVVHPAPPDLASLPRQRYDILLYVMETGVADIMDVDAPETAEWLPEMHRMTSEGITARRHISTYANSTNSIFSIITSRYPYADVQNVVRTAPRAQYETFVSVLRRAGYRTAALASIDNDYDRMNTFLLAHGFEHSEDRDSLHLTRVHEVFGSDWELARHYLRWLDQGDASHPSFAMMLPSNSHWPFMSKVRRFTGGSRIDAYRNAVIEQDQILGFIRAELEKRGRLQRTIIVLAPDHGSYFGLAEDAADDGSGLKVQHVPVVISHPAMRATHTPVAIDRVTSHVDLGPTLLDLVGAPALANVQGVSWLRATPSRFVFWTEPTSETIGATDGRTVVRWNRDENRFTFFEWSDESRSRRTTPAPQREQQLRAQLDLYRRYQYHYLRGLTGGH